MKYTIRIEKKMDHSTFGGTKACHQIVDMINSGYITPYFSTKIVSFFNDLTIALKKLDVIDDRLRNRFLVLFKQDRVKLVDSWTIPYDAKSFIKNVIHFRFKQHSHK